MHMILHQRQESLARILYVFSTGQHRTDSGVSCVGYFVIYIHNKCHTRTMPLRKPVSAETSYQCRLCIEPRFECGFSSTQLRQPCVIGI